MPAMGEPAATIYCAKAIITALGPTFNTRGRCSAKPARAKWIAPRGQLSRTTPALLPAAAPAYLPRRATTTPPSVRRSTLDLSDDEPLSRARIAPGNMVIFVIPSAAIGNNDRVLDADGTDSRPARLSGVSRLPTDWRWCSKLISEAGYTVSRPQPWSSSVALPSRSAAKVALIAAVGRERPGFTPESGSGSPSSPRSCIRPHLRRPPSCDQSASVHEFSLRGRFSRVLAARRKA